MHKNRRRKLLSQPKGHREQRAKLWYNRNPLVDNLLRSSWHSHAHIGIPNHPHAELEFIYASYMLQAL